MAFSFSNWFKKPAGSEPDGESGANPQPSAPSATAVPPMHPSSAPQPKAAAPAPGAASPTTLPTRATTRPIKTVMPNSVRPVGLHDTPRPTAHGGPAMGMPSSVSLRGNPAAMPTASAPRAISFPGVAAAVAAPAPAAPPPASVSMVAPNANITLTLGEFVDHIPASLLKAGAPVDRSRAVVFHAADLYSDLARGRAAVPVSAIQAVCPDLFSRPISPTEDVEVALPIQKLVEQLGTALQPRADQMAEDDVAEIETPFLQVALEDSLRLPKPPPSAPPRPHIAAVPPAAAPARRPSADPILMPTPGSHPSAANAAPGETVASNTASMRALTPRSVHVNPVRQPGADLSPAAPASLTGNPGVSSGIAAPTQSTVAPINPAKRPPSTVRASVAGGKIRLSGPAISSRSIAPTAVHIPAAPATPTAIKPIPVPAPAAAPASVPAQKKTARIQIPAISLRSSAGNNGANSGAPTMPPARTHGPSAITARPAVHPESPVAFQATPGETPAAMPALPVMPPPAARPLVTAPPPLGRAPILSSLPLMGFASPPPTPPAPEVPAPDEAAAPEEAAAADTAMIPLALGPILRSLPAGMFPAGLDGSTAAERVPDDARVELPLGFVTAQLAQGRVAVPHHQFVAAMPEAFRYLLPAVDEATEVVIPLPEVFQSLPTGAINRRHDQFVEEMGPEITTPFSIKAQEDAARLQAAADAAASVLEEAPAPQAPSPVADTVAEPEPMVAAEAFTPELAAPVGVPEDEIATETFPEAAAGEFPSDVVAETAPEEGWAEPAAAPVAAEEASPVEALTTEAAPTAMVDAAPSAEFVPEEEFSAQAETTVPETQTAVEPNEIPTALAVHEHADDGAEAARTEELPPEESGLTPQEPSSAATEEVTDAGVPDVSGELAEVPTEAPTGHLEPEAAPAPTAHEPETVTAMGAHESAPEDNLALAEETLVEEHSFIAPTEEQPPAPAEAGFMPSASTSEDLAQPEPEAPPVPRVTVPAALTHERESEPSALNGNGGRTGKPAHPSPAVVEEAQEVLRAIFMVDDDLDAKKIVKLVNQLPGLKACAVMFADGLKLAGAMESVSSSEGFCAMTPPFFRRAGNYARELNLGEIQCVTLQTERALLSFFMQGDICLSVQHAGNRSFLPGVREKLLNATGELAKMYALPTASH